MLGLTRVARPIAHALVSLFLLMNMPIGAVQAAMVGTETIVAGEPAATSARERLVSFFERRDVQRELEAQGIDPAEAFVRIDNLTDEEVEHVAGKLDQLPAGESTLGTILGAAIIVFVILLITDILGYTDIFPFVKKHK
ncbi:MAG: PA2779 family protein [Gammaproteobacteria bacterium]|nr:PA2779 family protein [Gammaproteobacteria bacterium]